MTEQRYGWGRAYRDGKVVCGRVHVTVGFDVPRLAAAVRTNAPDVIAFNGMKAGRAALGAVDGYGAQPTPFADADAWVLPSTSGAANRSWDAACWHDLAARVR
jgi:TDG/mug DNA glycosylase family protein